MPEHPHIVQSYEQELTTLSRKVCEMGRLAGKLLSDAVTALVARDRSLSAQVIAADLRMNRFENEIEDQAILMIAPAPAARRGPAPDRHRDPRRCGPGAHRRSRQEHRQARRLD